jgi:hypothetical protein
MQHEINAYNWEKFGLTYSSKISNPHWGSSHALVPTPVVIDSRNVAIFSSFIDDEFRGRIGRVDVDFSDGKPRISKVYHDPILDLGNAGTFSQYGVGMGAFWPNVIGGDLYFVAFDRPKDVKFKAFTGKAIFDENSQIYRHESSQPKFGQEMGGKTIVGLHDIFEFDGLIHALISIGSGFEIIDGKEFPQYQVHIASGPNLDRLIINPSPIIKATKPTYRIGRPRISKIMDGFEVLVTAGTTHGTYLPEAYYSTDLNKWTQIPIENFTKNTVPGFDDLHQCYLSRFEINGESWIVYNGNKMGIEGFGFAKGVLIVN